MNITISEPKPAPEMPVMWVVATPPTPLSTYKRWEQYGFSTETNANDFMRGCPFGSRLIKIDPSAPSFEPGPTEWVGSDKTKYSFDPTRPEWIDMMFDGEAPTTLCPNTRTDIGHVISALVTKWHAAKEGT